MWKSFVLATSKVVFVLLSLFAAEAAAQAFDPGWPRQKSGPEGKLIYYQPQVDSWKDHTDLEFRMAFVLTPKGQEDAVGIASVTAKTKVDVDQRTVYVYDVKIGATRFPSLSAAEGDALGRTFSTFFSSNNSFTIALDRLVALTAKPAPQKTVQLRNEAPAIFVSYKPAVIISTDGEPVFGKVANTQLEFVVNSNFPVFADRGANTYYVFTGTHWLKSPSLDGTWETAVSLPKDMGTLKSDKLWLQLASAIPPPASTEPVPQVFFSKKPAEVILFSGSPAYQVIPGTGLVFAVNTDSDLVAHGPTKTYYYLTAGRWFRSQSLEGPWEFATADLPSDFWKIPMDSPAARLLGFVPGTEQSKDAVLLAQIPTTAVVDPRAAEAKAQVYYLGQPEFKSIEGTALMYAVNTTEKVIKYQDVYYMCLNGVWFTSSKPDGPWKTATKVPSEIYSIPPSSPVYNVTYVQQSENDDGDIESSYTAGYLGAYMVGYGTGWMMTWGTGWYYPPYYYYPGYGYPIYYGYPATYGYGSYYNARTGAYGGFRGVYGPYGGATGFASYNPYTGTYLRGGTAYGPYGRASVARAYNPYTGTYAATRQRSTPFGQWGSSVVTRGGEAIRTAHVSNARRTIAGGSSTSGGKAIFGSGPNRSGGAIKTGGGDMYVGSDGNIFRNTGNGWERYQDGNWNNVERPAPHSRDVSPETMDRLNTERQNRQRGDYSTDRYNSMQRSNRSPSPSYRTTPRMGGFGGGRRGGFRR